MPRLIVHGQAQGPAACRIRASFSILEGTTRRVDVLEAYLSVFAEEIKERNDRSHFYVVISDSPLAFPSEVLSKSAFERRLKSDRIARRGRVLGGREYTIIDARAGQPETLRVASGTMSLTVFNPHRHRSADVALCFS